MRNKIPQYFIFFFLLLFFSLLDRLAKLLTDTLQPLMAKRGRGDEGRIEKGRMSLRPAVKGSGNPLPLGYFVRWSRD